MKKPFSFLGVLLAVASTSVVSAEAGDRATEIDNRLENQSGRIGAGRKHHKMTADEQVSADDAAYRVSDEEQRMRSKHNGNLTRRNQRRLNRQLNRNSRRIRRSKHNGN